jgi:hypothetical protein
MLNKQHFYHRITRKLVVGFGTMFNNIRLVRYNKAGNIEIERVTVPLSYSGKEKFYSRITQDPNLAQQVQITLPRMSFELTSITYDPLRKVSSYQSQFSPDTKNSMKSAYQAPYNFTFNLYIYVRNVEDGTQIVEQILPYFNPDYTLTMNLANVGNPVDVPIILETVASDLTNDTGSGDTERMIVWTLTFTAKAYLYGPINSGSGAKLIRKAVGNTFIEQSSVEPDRRLVMYSGGWGTYKSGELIFQGRKLEEATATAFVKYWNTSTNNMIINDVSGVFLSNNKVRGVVTGSTWTIDTAETIERQVFNLEVYPKPYNANANDDYRYIEALQEFDFFGDDTADATVIFTDNDNTTSDDDDNG